MNDQLSLGLSNAPRMGEFACGDRIAELASRAIRGAGKSRERIAAEMSDLTGESISVSMLNAYTASAKVKHRLPAEFTGAFCRATGDWSIIDLIARQAGGHLVGTAERAQLEVINLDEQMRELRRKKRELQALAQGRHRG